MLLLLLWRLVCHCWLLLLCLAAAAAGCTLLLCQLQQVMVILYEHAAAGCDEHCWVLA
jgi:UPF0716 family protein affecting phage T7 exclusion